MSKKPLWKGPYVDGITQSMIAKFLSCRERFRLYAIEGIKDVETGFPHAMEYGSLFHACIEADLEKRDWKKALKKYTLYLREKFPLHDDAVLKWSSICFYQFQVYKEHIKTNPLHQGNKLIKAEQSFKVPYLLPSGRTVILRGKIDGVILRGKSIYLQENKTKGRFSPDSLKYQITHNLQTLYYHLAARAVYSLLPNQIKGTLYNVIKRPLGDHTAIRQKKAETKEDFFKRAGYTKPKEEPEKWFHTWMVNLGSKEFSRLTEQILHPILEEVCRWWDWIILDPFDPYSPHRERIRANPHYQFPFGVYNSLTAGGGGQYFDLIARGKKDSVEKIDNLFPELEVEK